MNNFIPLLILLFIVGCKEHNSTLTTENGLKYKMLDIADSGVKPVVGDYVSLYISYKNENDSVFYESVNFKHNKIDRHKIEVIEEASFEEVLSELRLGDSAEIVINAARFFEDYVNAELPSFIGATENLTINIRLLDVMDVHEYQEALTQENDLMEMKELSIITDFINSSRAEYVQRQGVYFLKLAQVDSIHPVKYADIIRINYEARFLENDNLFYSTYRNGFPDEYAFGVQGQMIEGLKIGLSGCSPGDSLVVVIPSQLGFGDKPSAGNIVPPYSALKYTVKFEEVVADSTTLPE